MPVSIGVFVVFEAYNWLIVRKVHLDLQTEAFRFADHNCSLVHFQIRVEHNDEVMFVGWLR